MNFQVLKFLGEFDMVQKSVVLKKDFASWSYLTLKAALEALCLLTFSASCVPCLSPTLWSC